MQTILGFLIANSSAIEGRRQVVLNFSSQTHEVEDRIGRESQQCVFHREASLSAVIENCSKERVERPREDDVRHEEDVEYGFPEYAPRKPSVLVS